MLALWALGCGPPSAPPPVTPDLGTHVGGVRLFLDVRLAIAGEPWEPLEAPVFADDFRLEQLSLAVVGARSPSDRIDLPVPEGDVPMRIELVGGPRDVELVGASPATYGGALVEVAPPSPGAPSIELRFVRGEVTYDVVSEQPMTLDARCRGGAVQLDPNMRGELRLSLRTEPLVEAFADLEPEPAGTVRIDATSAPDVFARFERVLREEWELDCTSALEEPPASSSLVAEPTDLP